jgi:hypothetical protein
MVNVITASGKIVHDTAYDPTSLVREYINNTDPVYWMGICASRAGRESECVGSYFQSFRAELVDRLVRGLEWEVYNHSAVKGNAQAFIATCVPGWMNVVHISSVPPDATLVLEDPKNTGTVEVTWEQDKRGVPVDFVVLLAGPDRQNPSKTIVWTFFPGDPVTPSTIKRVIEVYSGDLGDDRAHTLDRHGTKILAHHAREVGVEWVKLKRR